MELTNPPVERTSVGLKISGTDIFLDPLQPVSCAVISHAHGDHAIPGHDIVYCSLNTAKLVRTRYRNFANKIITPEWMEEFTLNGIPLRLAPAGHMLGSSQICWDVDGMRTVYTGDYKRQYDPSCEPFQVVPCDILVTETTFAQHGKTHPDAEESIALLNNHADINFVIGAYSLGKAQRLTQLITKNLPNRSVMLHSKISKYHKIYEEAGFDLGPWLPFNRKSFRHDKNIIYIVPPPVLQNYIASPNYLRGFATGWNERQEGYELIIGVSDHADWHELLQTISDTGAKNIYTVHGDGSQLKVHLETTDFFINPI